MPTSDTPGKLRVISGVLDQIFSSTSNGLITFAVAGVSTTESFGEIALLMMALLAVLAAQRGAFGTPLLLKADQSVDRIRIEGSFALTAGLLIGAALAVAMVVLGWVIGLPAVLLAISAPIVLCQDVLRFVAISEGRPQVAVLWDGIWFAGTAVLLVLTWLDVRFTTVPLLLAGWGGLGLIALLGMAVNLGLLPRTRGIAAWIEAGWRHRVRYCLDASLEQTTVFVVLAMAATVLSPIATAALRGATVLLAPVGILGSALSLVVISESTRNSSAPRAVWFSIARVSAAVAVMSATIGTVLSLLPATVGSYLLGSSFVPAQQVLPMVTVEYVGACLTFAVGLFLKTFNRSVKALWFKFAIMATTLIAAVTTALVFRSATGVAFGLASATILTGLVAAAWFAPWKPRARAVSVDIAATADELH